MPTQQPSLPADVVSRYAEAEAASAYVPLGHYAEFLAFLRAQSDVVQVVTYKDLEWGSDWDYANGYPEEMKASRRALSRIPARDRPVQVLIQHDVDDVPDRTMAMLRLEEHYGIRSNVMVFNHRLRRRALAEKGELVLMPYELDDTYLSDLEKKGFVIGYHCNAYERARFDMNRAQALFTEDVEALRSRFTIEFFSCHGGVRDAHGRSNWCIEPPEWARHSLRWVHNRFGPVFSRTYTDGAFKAREPDSLDPGNQVRYWTPGLRYRILIHPQYFHVMPTYLPRMHGCRWYDEAFARYCPQRMDASVSPGTTATGNGSDSVEDWRDVNLRARPARERARLLVIERLRNWVNYRRRLWRASSQSNPS